MELQFSCLHGHLLEVRGLEQTAQRVVCPYCGSISEVRPEGVVDRQPLAVTVVPVSMVDAGHSGAWPVSESSASDALETSDFDSTDFPAVEARFDAERARKRRHRRSELELPTLPGYEVMEELGRGGMGVVYRAYDERHGRDVALKTLHRMRPDDVVRFKKEFRALADIAHPNLATLYELLSDGTTWCLTMEILSGVEFLDYVWSEFDAMQAEPQRAAAALPLDDEPRLSRRRINRLYDAIKQLAVGLDNLHRAGKLHSDIKPSNVLVSPDGRLVLLDFGLIAEISTDEDGRLPQVIQGTPHYMAPEQAACRPLTAASDWYAVGVMLYEVLTGRLPYIDTPARIMLRKQYETPLEPRRRQPDVPDDLNDLCMALLDQNPLRRPSAIEVLRAVDADDVACSLEAAGPTTTMQAVDLVGREPQLETLRQAVRDVAAGATRSVFVHGHSGMGKSVLIQTLLDEICEQGRAIVLAGRCYEQETVPFKALDSLIDSLVLHLSSLQPEQVRALLPRDSLPLTRLFPVLAELPGAADPDKPSIDNADQNELRQRALAALRELLGGLARHQPLVLYIDDMQWGDDDSSHLLADLMRPPECPPLLLLGSYRREEIDSSPALRSLSEAYQRGQHQPHRLDLPVDPLSTEEAARLALELLGRDTSAERRVAERIGQESGGSPFFVWELAQHARSGGDESAHGALELDEVIWSRVRRLPEETRRLLEVFAVAGRPMRAAEAYQAIEESSHGPSLLAQLRAGNFIRTTEQESQTVVETYHDRIRESVVNHLANAKVRGHHLKLALVIEQACDLRAKIDAHLARTEAFTEPSEPLTIDQPQWQRVFDLAFFFDAAGKPERSLPYALAAAEQALAQNALDVAEQQFEMARRGAETAAAAIKFRVAEGLGDVLLVRGRYERAGQQFQAARMLTDSRIAQSRIDRKLGVLAFKTGDMAAAAVHLEKGLAELGSPPPSNVITLSACLIKELIVQALHTGFPAWCTGRRAADTDRGRADLSRVQLYGGLCYPYWFTKGVVPTLWTHLREVNLAERYPPSQELGRAYSLHAVVMTAIPRAQRGVDYAERSYAIHGEMGDRHGQGKARSFQAFSYLCLGKFRQAMAAGREAIRLLEQAGDVWEANMARNIATLPMYFMGELQTASREARTAYEIGVETGDASGIAIALAFWVPLAPHQLPAGVIEEELKRPREDPLSASALVQGRGLELLLREDEPAKAAEVFQQSLDMAASRGIRNVCIFSGATWKATALRTVAQRAAKGPARRRALADARKALRTALKITRKYRPCRAQALRERGLIELLEGKHQAARKSFASSLQVAELQEARYEHAKTMLAQGEAGRSLGWPDADGQVADAQQTLDQLQASDDEQPVE